MESFLPSQFDARDCDGVGLQHAEVKSFSPSLVHEDSREAIDATIQYLYQGIYQLIARPLKLGTYTASVTITGADGVS